MGIVKKYKDAPGKNPEKILKKVLILMYKGVIMWNCMKLPRKEMPTNAQH